MTKKAIGILFLLFYVAIATYGQTDTSKSKRTDSTNTTSTYTIKPSTSQGEIGRFKIGAGVLFLRNPMINNALQTQSFLAPNIALEFKGKRFGVSIDLGYFKAESTLDTTIYNVGKGSLTQFFANASLLQTLPLNSNMSFRGAAGLGYIINDVNGFGSFGSSGDSGLNLNLSAGLEFHTASSFSYFIELGYRHFRSSDLGQLGGITLSFGFIIGPKPK
ncbi:hypothetical protein BKI52_11225 [marine bacterium AO1-C]|nr:hypothetical protein BKI52_11225 [marine bacterium AO1-C]